MKAQMVMLVCVCFCSVVVMLYSFWMLLTLLAGSIITIFNTKCENIEAQLKTMDAGVDSEYANPAVKDFYDENCPSYMLVYIALMTSITVRRLFLA